MKKEKEKSKEGKGRECGEVKPTPGFGGSRISSSSKNVLE